MGLVRGRKMGILSQQFGAGQYPAEYNPRVHGPYNPGTYYGKDLAFKDVKIGEMGAWIGRRSFHPLAIGRAMGRCWSRYQIKWFMARTPALAPPVQFCALLIGWFFIDTWKHRYHHCAVKYHW